VTLDIANLADRVPALNYVAADSYQMTPRGPIFRVRRYQPKRVNGEWRWRPVAVIEDGMLRPALVERYPTVSDFDLDARDALAAAVAVIESLTVAADGADYRPGEMLPEDYYAL